MPFPRKTSLAIVAFGALVLLMGAGKLLRPVEFAAVVDFQPRGVPVTVVADSPPRMPILPPGTAYGVKRPMLFPRPQGGMPTQIIDPAGSMRAFYQALERTAAGEGVTRVLHYGDSPVTADSITADLRSLLQARFGDAGHGFVLIAKPWAWYGHRGVEVRASGWTMQPATQAHARDGLHGLGGVSFEGGRGAWSVIHLESDHSRMEVSFLRRPTGGVFQVRAGDQSLGFVETSGPLQSAWATFAIPEGARDIRIEVQSGAVRLFGASFEKDGPGVIYNSLGLNGGQVQVVVRYFDPAHWSGQLQHYRPDLVVVNYGTNESLFPQYLETYYPGELRTVIRRIQAAVPEASVLIMSPMDKGERDSTGEIVTAPSLPRIVEIQREVARETGCAFFNTFEAMGGSGTMARWYSSQPRLVTADFTHPFPAGARKVGILADNAILAGYNRYRIAQRAGR
jgi:lysophospholipase L1-like esterase